MKQLTLDMNVDDVRELVKALNLIVNDKIQAAKGKTKQTTSSSFPTLPPPVECCDPRPFSPCLARRRGVLRPFLPVFCFPSPFLVSLLPLLTLFPEKAQPKLNMKETVDDADGDYDDGDDFM